MKFMGMKKDAFCDRICNQKYVLLHLQFLHICAIIFTEQI